MTRPNGILTERTEDGILCIMLDRPETHNAIDMAMAAEISALLSEANADQSVRCIVIAGAGGKAFSAGFDIHEMSSFDPSAMRDAFLARDPLMKQIATHRLPVIAVIEGIAYGAGALIACACDFRVAGPGARFKVTAINYGSANATWSLSRIVGATRAKDILMTGRAVDAEEGQRIGLYDRLAEAGQEMVSAMALAREIASKSPTGVEAVKALVDASIGQSIEQGWQAEHDHVLQSLSQQQKGGAQVFTSFIGNHKKQA